MNKVLDEGIKLAIHFLEKYGEFYPFGIVRCLGGQIEHVQVWKDGKRPTSDHVIDVLVCGLRNGVISGNYLTTGIVSNVRFRRQNESVVKDAICVDLEERGELAIRCCLPYVICDHKVKADEMIAEQGTSFVFR